MNMGQDIGSCNVSTLVVWVKDKRNLSIMVTLGTMFKEMDFGTYPTGWYSHLPNQVAVSMDYLCDFYSNKLIL